MICLTDYSKIEVYCGFEEGVSIGVPEWSIDVIIEGNIILPIEGFMEYS